MGGIGSLFLSTYLLSCPGRPATPPPRPAHHVQARAVWEAGTAGKPGRREAQPQSNVLRMPQASSSHCSFKPQVLPLLCGSIDWDENLIHTMNPLPPPPNSFQKMNPKFNTPAPNPCSRPLQAAGSSQKEPLQFTSCSPPLGPPPLRVQPPASSQAPPDSFFSFALSFLRGQWNLYNI